MVAGINTDPLPRSERRAREIESEATVGLFGTHYEIEWVPLLYNFFPENWMGIAVCKLFNDSRAWVREQSANLLLIHEDIISRLVREANNTHCSAQIVAGLVFLTTLT